MHTYAKCRSYLYICSMLFNVLVQEEDGRISELNYFSDCIMFYKINANNNISDTHSVEYSNKSISLSFISNLFRVFNYLYTQGP